MSKELLHDLEERGLVVFGGFIPGALVREILDLHYPETGTQAEFSRLTLEELKAVDYVRNILLGRGMYLSGLGGDYRILLASENHKQIDLYMASADKKLSRALKLSRNTPQPKKAPREHAQVEARILLKREGVRAGVGK